MAAINKRVCKANSVSKDGRYAGLTTGGKINA